MYVSASMLAINRLQRVSSPTHSRVLRAALRARSTKLSSGSACSPTSALILSASSPQYCAFVCHLHTTSASYVSTSIPAYGASHTRPCVHMP